MILFNLFNFSPHMQGHLCHRRHHRRVWRRRNFLLQGVHLQRQTCHCFKQRKNSNQLILILIYKCVLVRFRTTLLNKTPSHRTRTFDVQAGSLSSLRSISLFSLSSLSLHSHPNLSVVLILCCVQNLNHPFIVFGFHSHFEEALINQV